jgi:hypothetical protein
MQAHVVTDFNSTKDANDFLVALRAGIVAREKEYIQNRLACSYGPIEVHVWSLDKLGAAAFAEERMSFPRMTEIALFLDEGAYIACLELELKVIDLGGTDKTIPRQAKEIINEKFRTLRPYASIRESGS